jgi:tRNA-2-methylthio-N6-dimethylallyladenosine synthase
MGRHTARADYLEKIRCIRNARRAISISTDLIVGFCGETERDFEATLSLLDAVEYSQVFAFKYSPRPSTRAGGWPDSVPEEEKARRLHELQERQREIQLRGHRAMIGSTREVLVEGYQPRLQQAVGRTRCNRTVNFPGLPGDLGRYLNVRVTSAGPYSLVGERTDAPLPAGETSTGASIAGRPALSTCPGEGRN